MSNVQMYINKHLIVLRSLEMFRHDSAARSCCGLDLQGGDPNVVTRQLNTVIIYV